MADTATATKPASAFVAEFEARHQHPLWDRSPRPSQQWKSDGP